MNFAWRRFPDVCNAHHHHHLDICAPYPSGKWCHDLLGCEHPLNVLHTHPDGVPLPPLHVARHGPFAHCFDRWSRQRTDLLFVGDSQTKMLMFELLRWLEGGTLEPAWEMTQSGPVKASLLARAAYNLSRVGALFVGGLYSQGRSKDGTNLTQTAAALREAANSGAGRHAVFIVGVGIWDLVYSTEEDVARSFGLRFPWLLKEVLRAAQSYASAEIVVRNVFTSYTAGAEPVLVPRLAEVNAEIGRCFAEATTWALPPTVRLHFVDAYELSWPRRGEMPNSGDGLHWACISGEPHRPGPAQACLLKRDVWAGWQVVEISCAKRAREGRMRLLGQPCSWRSSERAHLQQQNTLLGTGFGASREAWVTRSRLLLAGRAACSVMFTACYLIMVSSNFKDLASSPSNVRLLVFCQSFFC